MGVSPEILAASPGSRLIELPSDQLALLGADDRVFEDREMLLKAVRNSLSYLRSERARETYTQYNYTGISRLMVIRSLRRFRRILTQSQTARELKHRIAQEFALYRPHNTGGAVRFTGYFQPTYEASIRPSAEFRYPIYRKPHNFDKWPKPHPSRVALEGYKGMGGDSGLLAGYELAWLRTRWEAFMIHVQGSAILELQDGSLMAVGFAAATDAPFRGISGSFMRANGVSWNGLPQFFNRYPSKLDGCLARNNRFIFFKANPTPDPIGNLGVPVIAERSIATDKKQMPPGALSLINTSIPYLSENGSIKLKRASRFVLDQDAGSAIKGPSRVDIFMGTGPGAQQKANHIYANGDLYFLLLRNQLA